MDTEGQKNLSISLIFITVIFLCTVKNYFKILRFSFLEEPSFNVDSLQISFVSSKITNVLDLVKLECVVIFYTVELKASVPSPS